MARRDVAQLSARQLRTHWKRCLIYIGDYTTYMEHHRIRIKQVGEWLGWPPDEFNHHLLSRNVQVWGWIETLGCSAPTRQRGSSMPSRFFVLDSSERAVLLKEQRGQGGFQTFMRRLQQQFRPGTNELKLTDEDLDNIPHYAFDFEGGGGWEDDLKAIFSRYLGPNLGR